jgi:N-methylhydantoinase B
VDFVPYAGMPHGAFGLFGGYPAGTGGLRAILQPGDDFEAGLAAGQHPVSAAALLQDGTATILLPPGEAGRVVIPQGDLQADFTQGGGGYGDPLEREPARVARDVVRHVVSPRMADILYGVVLDEEGQLDEPATQHRREAIRAERKAGSRPPVAGPAGASGSGAAGASEQSSLRFHEALEIVGFGQAATVRCLRCGQDLGPAAENYKLRALRRDRSLDELAGRPMPDGSPYLGVFREYACPGCATLLQVDVFVPQVGGEEDLWDIRIQR